MLLMLAMTACSTSGGGTVCTDLFAFVTAVTVDAGGAPAAGPFVVTDTVPRTAAVLTIAQQSYPVGTATIFSDSYRSDVRASGDSVLVTGVAAGKSFHARYLIGSDGCHVQKLAGPDTLTVR